MEKRKSSNFLKNFGLIIIFIALVLVLAVISGGAFVKPGNLISLIKQTAVNGILAMGMMFVIISDGHRPFGRLHGRSHRRDCLYVGASRSRRLRRSVPAACSGSGRAAGRRAGRRLQRYRHRLWRHPALHCNTGHHDGCARSCSDHFGGSPVFGVTDGFESIAAIKLPLFHFPILAVYLIIVVAISAFVLQKTTFGRRVYALGGNETAASVSGINVKRYRVAVYTIAGLLAGLCGLLVASRTITGAPTAGQSYEMDAIAAVVIGGVSMSGGSGKWHGVVIGALMIAAIANGLDIMRVDANWQPVIKGIIIILAVFMDIRSKAKKA